MFLQYVLFSCVLLLTEAYVGKLDANYLCEDSRCNCTENSVSCSCLGSQMQNFNIHLKRSYKFKKFETKNCVNVSIEQKKELYPYIHLSESGPPTISFKDINNLKFIGLDIWNMYHITLELENIGSLHLEKDSIILRRGVVSMKNVSSKRLPSGSLFCLEQRELRIENGHFDILERNAIGFGSLERLVVKGNHFETLESNSFYSRYNTVFSRYHAVDEVTFVNNTFGNVRTLALNLGRTVKMTVSDCKFSILHWGFLKVETQIFVFSGNEIDVASTMAFLNLEANESMEFVGNRFKLAEPNSLPTVKGLAGVSVVERNSFKCDCDLAWLWFVHKVDKVFFTNSTCEDGSSLASVNPDVGAMIECLGVNASKTDLIYHLPCDSREDFDSGFVRSQWFAVLIFFVVLLVIVGAILAVRKYGFPTVCIRMKLSPRVLMDMGRRDQQPFVEP